MRPCPCPRERHTSRTRRGSPQGGPHSPRGCRTCGMARPCGGSAAGGPSQSPPSAQCRVEISSAKAQTALSADRRDALRVPPGWGSVSPRGRREERTKNSLAHLACQSPPPPSSATSRGHRLVLTCGPADSSNLEKHPYRGSPPRSPGFGQRVNAHVTSCFRSLDQARSARRSQLDV